MIKFYIQTKIKNKRERCYILSGKLLLIIIDSKKNNFISEFKLKTITTQKKGKKDYNKLTMGAR